VEGVDLPADLGVLVLDVGELLLEVAEPGEALGGEDEDGGRRSRPPGAWRPGDPFGQEDERRTRRSCHEKGCPGQLSTGGRGGRTPERTGSSTRA